MPGLATMMPRSIGRAHRDGGQSRIIRTAAAAVDPAGRRRRPRHDAAERIRPGRNAHASPFCFPRCMIFGATTRPADRARRVVVDRERCRAGRARVCVQSAICDVARPGCDRRAGIGCWGRAVAAWPSAVLVGSRGHSGLVAPAGHGGGRCARSARAHVHVGRRCRSARALQGCPSRVLNLLPALKHYHGDRGCASCTRGRTTTRYVSRVIRLAILDAYRPVQCPPCPAARTADHKPQSAPELRLSQHQAAGADRGLHGTRHLAADSAQALAAGGRGHRRRWGAPVGRTPACRPRRTARRGAPACAGFAVHPAPDALGSAAESPQLGAISTPIQWRRIAAECIPYTVHRLRRAGTTDKSVPRNARRG